MSKIDGNFLLTLAGAVAATWAAVVATAQLRMQSKRPAPFFTAQRGGPAFRWPGFITFNLIAKNPYPIPFEIQSVAVQRDWRQPFQRLKLSPFRSTDTVVFTTEPDLTPDNTDGLTRRFDYSDVVVPAALNNGQSSHRALQLAVSGLSSRQSLSIRYRWLDQSRLSKATITI